MPQPMSARSNFVPCDVCGEPTSSRAVGARGYARHHACIKHGLESTYKRGCRCDECQRAAATAQREWARRYSERTGQSYYSQYDRPNRPRSAIECADCGERLKFGGNASADGIARCMACYRVAKKKRARAETRRRQAATRLKKAARGVPANPRWPLVQGRCARCGEWFTRRGQASPYCSVVCRRKDRPSRSWISRSARHAIYERDGWICQLCSEPVDPHLHYLDDWAASLDHIECQAWALIPDHSPRNLRLAHRWCNAVRGDETHYSELDLRAA